MEVAFIYSLKPSTVQIYIYFTLNRLTVVPYAQLARYYEAAVGRERKAPNVYYFYYFIQTHSLAS